MHVALIVLLVVGVGGSFWMSLRARSMAQARATEQAQVIVDSSLTLVFRPDDLERQASADRARELSRAIEDVVLDPSDFETVSLFSPSGQILFSTKGGQIGNRLAGERDRIREAYRGDPAPRIVDDTLSVMVGLHFPSGVGDPAAIELLRPADDIVAASGPWRTNMFFLAGALVLVGVAASGGRRHEGATVSEPLRMRVPVVPTRQPPAPSKRTPEAPQPGLREEAEARRRAEDRAQAAEQRLVLLQDQYRATLMELQETQRSIRETPVGPDRQLEERAVKAEAAVRTLEQRLHSVTTERDRIAGELLARRDATQAGEFEQLHQVEAEAMGLRAELEGAQTQLSMTMQELAAIQRQAERSRELQEELDAAQLESLHATDAMHAMESELRGARTELEDARGELRALRSEEQRAAMLTDELRAAKAELESTRASHEAELIEREADLEDKVRAVREEFQAQLAETESRHAAELAERDAQLAAKAAEVSEGARAVTERMAAVDADLEAARSESQARAVDLESARAELQAAHDTIRTLQGDLTAHQTETDRREEDVRRARAQAETLSAELSEVRSSLEAAEAALEQERTGRADLERVEARTEREAVQASERADHLAEELEAAILANTELNRKLQEIEARRALEVAEDEGRAHMDELLSATQERLAGQSDKLIAAEERARELERQAALDADRLEQLEAQLRQHQMAEQIREMQAPKHEPEETTDVPALEDRRTSTPFVNEMSMDAQKTISRIIGVTQLLKHKRDSSKEHAQLVQQLTAHARRLENTIRDIADVDSLVTGSVELDFRNTDLESLIRRVVEESGAEADHDVRVEAEPTSISIDRTRTEQIVGGLLRSASDRTPAGKTITLRLLRAKGGAVIVVEDSEASSDTSMSPMVRRLAEVQGGSAKVESREGGGSAFTIFLPHGGKDGAAMPEPVAVEEADTEPVDDPDHWVNAEQALVRELRQLAQGKAKK